jgi:hypothetical protein
MARLWKNGKEVLRVSKEKNFEDGEYSWERITRTVHENGVILTKHDSLLRGDSRRYGGTWKKRGRVKAGVTIQAVKERYEKNGWKIENYSPGPSRPGTFNAKPAMRGLFTE